MPRTDGEVTRDQIKDVAFKLLMQKGFSATSLREIAERMGFTKAALYYHYPSKDALLEAILDPVLTDHESLLDRVDPSDAPSVFLEEYLRLTVAHRGVGRIFSRDPSVFSHPGVGPRLEKLLGRQMSVLGGDGGPEDLLRARATLYAMGAALESDAAEDLLQSTMLGVGLAILGSSPVETH